MSITPAMAAALTIASSAIKIAGHIRAGKHQRNVADYNAQVARQNAILHQRESAIEQQQLEREGTQRMGSAAAKLAKSGVTLSSESALTVFGDIAEQIEQDKLISQYEADIQSRNFISEADLTTHKGEQALMASYISSAGEAFEGASQAVSILGKADKSDDAPELES